MIWGTVGRERSYISELDHVERWRPKQLVIGIADDHPNVVWLSDDQRGKYRTVIDARDKPVSWRRQNWTDRAELDRWGRLYRLIRHISVYGVRSNKSMNEIRAAVSEAVLLEFSQMGLGEADNIRIVGRSPEHWERDKVRTEMSKYFK